MNKYEVLVNKENYVDKEFYKKFKLIEVKNFENEIIKIENKTYKEFLKLKNKVFKKENIKIHILNSFRDFEEQERICKEYVEFYGEDLAYKLAAIPGTSEHHTGLAIDITVDKNDGKFAETNEELYDENQRFLIVHKYLAKYGFILRYPSDKTEITKYNYEPWHIRFIGKRIANKCFNEKICLEEYYDKYIIKK